MTTINPVRDSLSARGIHEEEHLSWTKAFGYETRIQQLNEDHQAWTRVTGTLLTIVSIGVLLATISVAICMAN